MRMKVNLEIVPFGMLVCACGAMLYTINHLHPDCVVGKDLCEIRMAHLKDGHEREPVPANTRYAMTVTTSALMTLNTGTDFPAVR
jgi:hypothetical protein